MKLSSLVDHVQAQALARTRSMRSKSGSISTSVTTESLYSDPNHNSICFDEEGLIERARVVYDTIDIAAVANDKRSEWKLVEANNELSLFTRQVQANVPEVMCRGRIDSASLQELSNLLHANSDAEFGSSMSAIYTKGFIFGSIDQSIVPDSVAPCRSNAHSETSSTVCDGESVSVKSTTFVHADMFGKNEQWCFLEHFQRKPERNGFTLTMSSLRPGEHTSSKLETERVDQLYGLTASCLVEKMSSRKGVRVTFYAWYNGSCPIGQRDLAASAKVAKARLLLLAKGMARLPDVMRRRRFGMQKLADLSAFTAKNSRCICCTRSFRMFAKKKRCYLCGYFVCDSCWSLEQMETYNGHIVGIVICTRCTSCVDACDYSRMRPQDRGPVCVQPDAEDPDSASRGKELINYLETLMSTSPTKEQKGAVVSLIRTMLDDDRSSTESRAAAERSKSIAEYRDSPSLRGSIVSTTSSKEFDQATLRRFGSFLQSSRLSLDKCVLANAEKRSYPLQMPAEPNQLIVAPLPSDEERRLDLIEQYKLREMTNVPELELICELAALEMQCPPALISIMSRDQQIVLASNVDDLKTATFNRSQTCCQHTIMTEQPMLVKYPTADVRFQAIPSISDMNVQFYCGYPIAFSCGTVVGTLCCFDTEAREMTQSQYSTMNSLAKTAARLLENKSRERVSVPVCNPVDCSVALTA